MHRNRTARRPLSHYLCLIIVAISAILSLAPPLLAQEFSYTYGGNANWFSQSAVTYAGGTAFQSGAIGSGQSSWMQSTVTGPGAIRFWWKVSSEACCDPLTFSIDGVSQANIRGEIGWQSKIFAVPAGSHTLRWTYSTDSSVVSASNAGWVDQVTFTAGIFDLAPPVTSATPPAGTYASAQNVTLSCTDDVGCTGTYYCLGSGCNPTSLYTGAVPVSGATDLRFYSTDAAGNNESVKTAHYTLDTLPPVTSAYPSGGTFAGRQEVSLSCSDSGMHCKATYYCLGIGCTPSTLYTIPVPLSASTELRFFSTDNGGNAETVRSASYTILPDTVPPVTTASRNDYYPSSWVSLNCSDDASGCDSTYYCLGSGCTPTTRYGYGLYLTDSTEIRYYSTDRSGNAEAVQSFSYAVDRTPPVTKADLPGGTYPSAPLVTLSCSDGGSGCLTTYYCFGDKCTPTTQYQGPIGIKDAAVLRFYSLDKARNSEAVVTERYVRGAQPTTITVPAMRGTIQGGIDAAYNGDTVLVAPGTYRENIDFRGKSITVTSSDGAQSTIIDGNQAGSVVLFVSGEDSKAVLNGFTIRNGLSSIYDGGGGVRVENSSPTITRNRITENSSCEGPGVYVDNGSPLIQENTISKNRRDGCTGGFGGGGILVTGGGSVQILDNDISDNTMYAGDGGGINLSGSYGVIRGNRITGNKAYGLIPCAQGGGIAVSSTNVQIGQNLLAGNSAECGGGIYWRGGGTSGDSYFFNNTVAENDSPQGSGIYADSLGPHDHMVNNIVVSKRGQTAITCGSYELTKSPDLKSNAVYEAGGSRYGGTCADQTGINGNIGASPRLADATRGFFGLLPGSPAIDAASGAAPALPATDLDGRARAVDGNNDGNATADLGAFEFDPSPPSAVLSGVPSAFFTEDTLTITVGGDGTASYRYAVDGGTFSGDIPAETAITLTGLPNGNHFLVVLAKNATGAEQPLSSATTAAWAVNRERTDLTFNSGGATPWFLQAGESHDGIAYQSGALADGQSNWIETEVTGPGALRFWWKVSDSDYGSPLTFTIDGNSRGSTNNSQWQPNTFTIPSGRHTVRWSYAVSPYSWLSSPTAWLDGVSFTQGSDLDVTAPVTSAAPDSGTLVGSQSVTLSCSDNVACAGTFYCLGYGCNPTTPYSGALTIVTASVLHFYSTDGAGNAEPVRSASYSFDTGAPTTNAYPSGGSYFGPHTVSLTCGDYSSPSLGCDRTYWCLGSGCTPDTLYTAPITFTTSGDLRYYSTDKGGNTGKIVTQRYTILPDVTAPQTRANPSSGNYRSTSIDLYCSDDSGGCATTYYCTGKGCQPTTRFSGTIEISASTTLRYYSVDASGNAEHVKEAAYAIDNAAPVTTPSIAGGIYRAPQVVTLTCDDGVGTGCSSTYYCVGSGSCSPDTVYTGPIEIASTAYLRFYSRDRSDNSEGEREVRFNIAGAAPAVRNVPADYPTIQGAIDAAADGDTVLVAPGTYLENIDFRGKAITVQGSGGPAVTAIDGGGNGSVVVFSSDEWRTSVLTGFTIRNGAASTLTTGGRYGGGGVYIEGASPSVVGNLIVENRACEGAGILSSGAPLISNNTISRNVQRGCSSGGGGIMLWGGSAEVLDNLIADNTVTNASGGGMAVMYGNHSIRGNIIRNNGGERAYGGGVYGGASAEFIQNVVSGNRAGRGGGFYLVSSAVLINNTITDNDSEGGSAIFLGYPVYRVTLENNIISGKGGQTIIHKDGDGGNSAIPFTLRHNVLFSPSGSLFDWSYDFQEGDGNVVADPRLAASASGYYGLLPGSPAIDAGDGAVAGVPTTDVTGAPRVLAGTADRPAVIDAGAFEFNPAEPRAEISGAPAAASRETSATITVGGAGIVSYRYAVDGGAFGSEDIAVSTPIELAGLSSGSHVVAVTGTSATRTQRAASATVARWNIDAVPPVTSASPAGGVFAAPQAVTLSCDDGSGSGCAATFYCLGADCTPTTPYSAPFTVASSTAVRYFSRDAFGYEEGVKTSSYSFVASVSGRVTDSVTGAAVASVNITAYSAATGSYVGSSYTDNSGAWSISGLSAGGYKFLFFGNGYLSQWNDGKSDRAAAPAVAVAAPGSTTGVDAVLVSGGSISGTVTDSETGAPVAYAGITVYAGGSYVFGASTNSFGTYRISGLASGTYQVKFTPPSGANYLAEWYGTPVSVAAPNVTAGIDWKLKKGGSITGTVKDSAGAAVTGAYVAAYDANTGWAASAYADSSGRYSLAGLSGKYKVSCSADSYVTVWYGGSFTQAGGSTVPVSAPGTAAAVDFVLVQGGGITGTVTDKVSGKGIANAYVYAYQTTTGSYGPGTSTDSTGAYTLSGLATGSYSVSFSASGYVSQWSGGGTDAASASKIAVTAAHTTSGVNMGLTKGGSISGTVTDKKTGLPLEGIGMIADDGTRSTWASTNSQGGYTITGLPDGSYKVSTASGGMQYYQQSYRDPATGAPKSVVVVAPNDVTGIDLALEEGAAITGTVSEKGTGNVVPQAYVTAYEAGTGRWAASGHSDNSGGYTISPLPTGSYKLRFSGSGYLPVWSGGQRSIDEAVALAVTAPGTSAGVDMELERGGSISGTISESGSGVAIVGAYVYAIDQSTASWAGSGVTGNDGSYTITSLPSGTYRIRIESHAGYVSRWYGSECADTVTVKASATTAGADAHLSLGGSISGRVTDAVTGLGISGVSVNVYNGGGAVYPSVTVDETGAYTVGGLPSGDYRLAFSALGYVFSGDSVVATVSAPQATSVDATLNPGGTISGKITDAGTGAAIADVLVQAVDSTTGAVVGSATTGYQGNYRISGVPAGKYRVEADGRYAASGYGTGTFQGEVPVAVPETTSGIDCTLTRDGALTGRLLDAVSGAAVSGVEVRAYNATEPTLVVATAYSDSAGRYTLWVPSGTYRVEFLSKGASDGGSLGRWYQSGADTAPTTVAVQAPETVHLSDTELDRAGGISGHISLNGCPLPASIYVNAYDAQTGKVVRSTVEDPSYGGGFTIGALPTGNYKLSFPPAGSGFVGQWYPGKTDFATAEAIAVTAGSITEGIDVTIAAGGGSVSGAACTAWYGVVRLHDWYSGGVVAETRASHGGFRFNGIPDGTYKVLFATGAEGRWYLAPRDSGLASRVVVSGAAPVSGIDMTEACPDGSLGSMGKSPTVADALIALRVVVGLDEATPAVVAQYDVAPIMGGVPAPDGKVEIDDVVAILRMSIGIQVFQPLLPPVALPVGSVGADATGVINSGGINFGSVTTSVSYGSTTTIW